MGAVRRGPGRCVLCGVLQRCMDSMAGCKCPLAEMDDGDHVCLVTGLCIRKVRARATEYMDHVVFESPPEQRSVEDEGLYARMYAVVHWFFTSSRTGGCLKQEREQYVAKSRQASWRVLLQRKKERPYDLGVVAEVARIEQSSPLCQAPAPGAPPSLVGRLVQVCAANIALCLFQVQRMGLKKVCPGARFQSMVVGMLYIMMARTGLRGPVTPFGRGGGARAAALRDVPQPPSGHLRHRERDQVLHPGVCGEAAPLIGAGLSNSTLYGLGNAPLSLHPQHVSMTGSLLDSTRMSSCGASPVFRTEMDWIRSGSARWIRSRTSLKISKSLFGSSRPVTASPRIRCSCWPRSTTRTDASGVCRCAAGR